MSSTPMPPRFVPTLTEVVQPESIAVQPFVADIGVSAKTALPMAASTDPDQALNQFEDQLLHRVMQRVDLVLEQRLHEAMSQVILAHTQTLGPRLREEIELVVRESVSQAIAQELPLLTQGM